MNVTLMAILLIAIVVVTVVTDKVPFNFVLLIVPLIFSLLLGHSLTQTSNFVLQQFASLMQTTGFMLLFAFLYFTMLTESGMFNTIVNALTSHLKMNVIVLMVLTTLIGGFSILTGNFTPAYLITFPILLPLYKKFNFDRGYAFMIAQTAMSAMCFIPWGIGMAYTASAAGLSATALSKASLPWAYCFIPVIILQWIYFGWKHRQKNGTFQVIEQEETAAEVEEEKENSRPQFFWINLIVFIIAMVALGVYSVPPYLVFIIATVFTAMVNYPKDYGKIFGSVGPMYLNILIMLLAINMYQAVFNNTGMVGALSKSLISVVPHPVLHYLHIILLLLCVIIIYFIPFQIFNALYPIFITIGAAFGIPAVAMIAPFVCNLSLATSATPTNSSTYVGCGLLDLEVPEYTKRAVPVMTITNLLVIIIAAMFGVLNLG
ncbi:citrate:H+ symporter [Ligilactobacillus sp. WILCCON 0076]|uniref:Citrate:H+ symporter n=1 Tax=Ligilactobacillus ubinensis TaxID=2876789 RepID=A0A9X2JM20_9LACO|nr:SLC13 family permease [Ligilactobacillus ubinensis]MCP0887548.1 citrate:H+ symporter [Ligilactobacillus ubinensis]